MLPFSYTLFNASKLSTSGFWPMIVFLFNSLTSLGIRPVWSEYLLCLQWVVKDPRFLHADREDSDQTGWMPRLIWAFAGRTLILLVLSCCGSLLFRSVFRSYLTSLFFVHRKEASALTTPMTHLYEMGSHSAISPVVYITSVYHTSTGKTGWRRWPRLDWTLYRCKLGQNEIYIWFLFHAKTI